MSTSVRFQFTEVRQMLYEKHLAEFIEIYGEDIGKKKTVIYADLSARLHMVFEHKKLAKKRAAGGAR
jgi:hypothetical protein